MALHISDTQRKKIQETASLEEIFTEHISGIKKSGMNLVGTCPLCSSSKGLNYTKKGKDEIVKCFSCGEATKNNAPDFLQKFIGIQFPDNYIDLANKYNIDLAEKKKKGKHFKASFRNQQLLASGIPDKAQKYIIRIDSATEQEADRYEKGTVTDGGRIDRKGDDMILHYVDLDGKPMTYVTPHSKKEVPYYRVRYRNPSQQPVGKDGKHPKYRTPYGAGVKLWFPQQLINEYRKPNKFHDTLVITEGEKKADVLSCAGILCVGISGIHNFASKGSTMPYQFQLIIKEFNVKNVVFLLDADWADISVSVNKPVDLRPKSFASAVIKFRDYFHSYINEGIELGIFWGAHKDGHFKGIDDLIAGDKKAKENIKDDFPKAMIDRDGAGDFLQLYKINTMSEYKIKDFWHLSSADSFMAHYKEKLKEVPEFKYNRLRWRYNKDNDKLEMIEKILPGEKFWTVFVHPTTGQEKYQWRHVEFRHFLYNRKIGRLALSEKDFRFIQIDQKIVHEVTHNNIQDYVIDFTEQLGNKEVQELLLRGGTQYVGPNKLNNVKFVQPTFHEPAKDFQYLFFNNSYWKIEIDKISTGKLTDLPFHIWKDNIIDQDPELLKEPLFSMERTEDDWEIHLSENFSKSDICMFFNNTSNFAWEKSFKLQKTSKGKFYYSQKKNAEPYTQEEVKEYKAQLAAKILATGYVLHQYNDYSNMRAIITMDGVETEVGKSDGGTGKSLWSMLFKPVLNTFRIDGKDPKIAENRFIFDGVNERTGLIVFDDLRVNFDFETWLNVITNGVPVNEKGNRQFMLDPIKIVMNTNHAVNGDGNSFLRRQYIIAFSNYYNQYRTPESDFGRLMMRDWDHKQWNYYFNFLAVCIQNKLKYQLDYTIPQEDVKRRKLRQAIGESFIAFARDRYDSSNDLTWLNHEVEKNWAYEQFQKEYRRDANYINIRNFKSKFKMYAEYSDLAFNPQKGGQRIVSGGAEYFSLANDEFNALETKKFNHENPRGQNPFS